MRDRFPLLLIGAFVLAGAIGASMCGSARRGEFADRLSTFRSGKKGSRALFLLATESGIHVERRTQRLTQLDDLGALVLLGVDAEQGEPIFDARDGGEEDEAAAREEEQNREGRGLGNQLRATPLDESEITAVLAWVRKGHALVYAPWRRLQDPLLTAAHVQLGEVGRELTIRTVVPALPTRFTASVERIETEVRSFLRLDGPAVPLLVDDRTGEAVASITNVGTGHVLVLGAPELGANEALARAGNAQLWLSLLGALRPGQMIAFDEYHHGFSGERSIAEFGKRYGLHWAIAQLLFGLCFWAAALRRFGRAQPPIEPDRVGALDSLGATSRLYLEGNHHAHAAGLLLRALFAELAPRAGTAPQATQTAVVSGLRSRGETRLAAKLEGLLAQAGVTTDASDVRRLAEDVAQVRRDLSPRSRTPATS